MWWAPDSMSDERFVQFWRRTHERGFWLYFLIRLAFWLLVVLVFFPGLLFLPVMDPGFGLGLAFFTAAAISFIPFTWRRHQARYRRLLAREQRTVFD